MNESRNYADASLDSVYEAQRRAEIKRCLVMQRAKGKEQELANYYTEHADLLNPLQNVDGECVLPDTTTQIELCAKNENTKIVEQSNPSTPSKSSYAFPINLPDNPTSGTLSERMSKLIAEWREHKNYMLIREEYCALSIAMNHEGLQAPAFRPALTIPFLKKDQQESDKTLHKDRVVIDCHWLHCRGEHITPRDDQYKPLFNLAEPFLFTLASLFASENWTNKHRAEEALILIDWQQSQLMAMVGEIVCERRKTALDGIGKGDNRKPPKITLVKRTLGEWSRRDKRIIQHIKTYESLWLARELLGASASMNDIALLGALIAGVPPSSERVARDKLKRLDARISGAAM